MFFLIYLLVFVVLIIASWLPAIAKNPIGITEVFPAIWKSAEKCFSLKDGNALTIIAFAFLIYAVLQSKAFQALFASKRKWLQKRKFATIAIITVITSLLASSFWWADEFFHFYPLLVPLLLAMGFDIFSSVLCLWGGTIVGIIGSINCEGHQARFSLVNEKANTHFTGTEGLLFRVIIWVILTTILVFFNIWYCNKIQKKPAALPVKEVQSKKPPTFNWRKKLVLFFAFFFVVVSILGTFGCFAKLTEKVSENIPEQICNEEEVKEYKELGTVKTSPDSSSEKNEIEIAEVVKKKESSWGKFGKWDNPQKCYWFTIGGIVICLIAKLNIINILITTITKTTPIIITYIFAYAVPLLIKAMDLQINPLSPLLKNRFVALPAIFLVIFALCFFSINIIKSILPIIAKSLKSLSTNTLAYSVTVMLMARFLASGISPMEGNLQMTLKINKLTYKKYIKKTWVLWTIVFIVCFTLISVLPFFIDRASG